VDLPDRKFLRRRRRRVSLQSDDQMTWEMSGLTELDGSKERPIDPTTFQFAVPDDEEASAPHEV
jgi:hypothetical protein